MQTSRTKRLISKRSARLCLATCASLCIKWKLQDPKADSIGLSAPTDGVGLKVIETQHGISSPTGGLHWVPCSMLDEEGEDLHPAIGDPDATLSIRFYLLFGQRGCLSQCQGA